VLNQIKAVVFWAVVAVTALVLTGCSDEAKTTDTKSPTGVVVAAVDENPGWLSSFGQGVHEYSAASSTGQLTIACMDGDNVHAIATISGQDYSSLTYESQFDVELDGVVIEAPFALPSRGDGEKADVFWAAMRNAKTIAVIKNGQRAEIPTKGIKETVPELNSAASACQLTW